MLVNPTDSTYPKSAPGTINNMKTAQGTGPCSKAIFYLHSEIFRYTLY